ncbi:hypothetical protein ACFLU6_09530 [Acidobacteriota bacterium]
MVYNAIVMKTGLSDTTDGVEQLRIEAFRRMTPAEKLRIVMDLNQTILRLAEIRIKNKHGKNIPVRELRLRLASLWLDRDTMIRVFNWDPEIHGY